MKAFKNIAVFGGIFVSGILSSYLGLMPTVAVITLVVGLVIIFTDYEKATLIAALYTAFEFVLRSDSASRFSDSFNVRKKSLF